MWLFCVIMNTGLWFYCKPQFDVPLCNDTASTRCGHGRVINVFVCYLCSNRASSLPKPAVAPKVWDLHTHTASERTQLEYCEWIVCMLLYPSKTDTQQYFMYAWVLVLHVYFKSVPARFSYLSCINVFRIETAYWTFNNIYYLFFFILYETVCNCSVLHWSHMIHVSH